MAEMNTGVSEALETISIEALAQPGDILERIEEVFHKNNIHVAVPKTFEDLTAIISDLQDIVWDDDKSSDDRQGAYEEMLLIFIMISLRYYESIDIARHLTDNGVLYNLGNPNTFEGKKKS